MSAAVKNRGGRPTRLSEEVIELLAAYMTLGFTPGQAARAAGVAPRTLRLWRARAWSRLPEDAPFVALEQRLREAQVEAGRTAWLDGLWDG